MAKYTLRMFPSRVEQGPLSLQPNFSRNLLPALSKRPGGVETCSQSGCHRILGAVSAMNCLVSTKFWIINTFRAMGIAQKKFLMGKSLSKRLKKNHFLNMLELSTKSVDDPKVKSKKVPLQRYGSSFQTSSEKKRSRPERTSPFHHDASHHVPVDMLASPRLESDPAPVHGEQSRLMQADDTPKPGADGDDCKTGSKRVTAALPLLARYSRASTLPRISPFSTIVP